MRRGPPRSRSQHPPPILRHRQREVDRPLALRCGIRLPRGAMSWLAGGAIDRQCPLQATRAFAGLAADYPRHFEWIRFENPGITRHCVTLRIILLFCATGPHIPEKHDGAKQRFKTNNNGRRPKSRQTYQDISKALDYRYKRRRQILAALGCSLEATHIFQPKRDMAVWKAMSKSSKVKRAPAKESITPRLCLYVNKQPLQVEVQYAKDMELKQFSNTDSRAERVHYNASDFDCEGLKVRGHNVMRAYGGP